MVNYPRRRRVYRGRRKSTYRKRTVIRPRKQFKKAIQKIVNSNIETKVANTNTGSSLVFFDSQIVAAGDIMQIVPNVTKGVQENNRISNMIQAQKLVIKGYVRFNTLSNVNNKYSQVAVRLFLVSLKQRSNYNDVQSSTTYLNVLLRRGGTEVPWSGLISDIYADLNTDVWTKHMDKVMYLSQDQMFTDAGSIDTHKTIRFFRKTISCKKVLRYDDTISSGLLPTNFAPILLIGYCYMNGAAPDQAPVQNLGLYYDSDLYFKDA